ncbi:hypothetical protein BDY19DRAFT_265859 [Irpex rosettiformis]|uniref:Uncharacterized protein n=1 Tax=Irpex rosettiformis TaxID=378272 RepID=A0ACB8UH17_9APHY|nr:hypothetical protein BDY19DRAFT_265859 [Irpex rosettiformis]
MNKSITLWRRNVKVSTDDACTTIASYSLPGYVPGPYEQQKSLGTRGPLNYIPSLQSLCIRQLIPFPDQIYTMGIFSLPYEPPETRGDYDILHELIPEFWYVLQTRDNSFLKCVDPRLWAVVVQVYTGLPEVFRTYNIPLSDLHVPLLQQIPSTSRFSLVTILSLYGCEHVDDNTVVELRDMHGLAGLNVGGTALSSWGLSRFSKLLRHADLQDQNYGRRLVGPWELRILSLRNCMNVDDDVYKNLKLFPLLSVVDLRGTRCTPSSYRTSGFKPSEERALFSPTPLEDSLMHLSKCPISPGTSEPLHTTPTFYAHPQPFYLRINSLNHAPTPVPRTSLSDIDDFIAGSPPRKRDVFMGNGMEDRVWTAQSHSSDRRLTTNDILAVAGLESRRMSAEASVLAFYATNHYHYDSERLPSLGDLPPDQTFSTGRQKPMAGLTLYRPPRPWADIELIARGKSASGASTGKQASIPAKRPRMEIDEALMGANEAKRKGQAQKAVNALWGMVERRKSAPECVSTTTPKAVVNVVGNPFLRKVASMRSSLDGGLVKFVVDQDVPDTNTEKAISTEDSLETVEKSILPVPPPTTKPLKPISTFSVPNHPLEPPKLKSKSSKTKFSKSVENIRQMKLPVFAEEAAKSSKRTSRSILGSAGAAGGGSADSAKFSSSVDSDHVGDPVKEIGRVVHAKRKKKSGFDWKGWSTSINHGQ